MSVQGKALWHRFALPLFLLLIALLLLRIWLPIGVRDYVNSALNELPGYQGEVADIDLALYRGAYVATNLRLDKLEAGSSRPFLRIQRIDISVQWRGLLHGEVVSEIELTHPVLQYIPQDHDSDQATDPEPSDWFKTLTELAPITINRVEIRDGELAFRNFLAEPPVDLHLEHADLLATDLRNVIPDNRELASNLLAEATSIGGGQFKLEGKMLMLEKIPEVDLAFSLEGADATSLNDFSSHYANVDFEAGVVEVYGELAIAQGVMVGYIKPLLTGLQYTSTEDGVLENIWEGLVSLVTTLLENPNSEAVGSKVSFEGDLNEIDTEAFAAFVSILKNAWIEALKRSIDHEIDYGDAQEVSG